MSFLADVEGGKGKCVRPVCGVHRPSAEYVDDWNAAGCTPFEAHQNQGPAGLAWLDDAQLAAKRRGPLIALDAEIERDAGSSMNEMMLPYGQAYCRCNERYALFRNAEGYTNSMVMPTVLSIVCETFNQLQSRFYGVSRQASQEKYMTHVAALGDIRPSGASRCFCTSRCRGKRCYSLLTPTKFF